MKHDRSRLWSIEPKKAREKPVWPAALRVQQWSSRYAAPPTESRTPLGLPLGRYFCGRGCAGCGRYRERRTRPTFGSALYSSSSEIAVRMISSGPVPNFPALLRERIRQAIALPRTAGA